MPSAEPPPPDAKREIAPVKIRHQVYSCLLEHLELAEDHLVALTSSYPMGRGMAESEVCRLEYRTLRRGRARAARAVLEKFSPEILGSVPGFYFHKGNPGDRPYWSITGGSGLLIPVRDLDGRIAGLQVRLDDPKGAKYKWLSSAYHEGPAAEVSCHVPLHDGTTDIVRITEGPIKADVASTKDPERILTLAFPGVATWRCVLPVLEGLRTKTIRIAFDADIRTNPRVARSFEDCVTELGKLGYRRELEIWTGHKGIDDLFAAGGRPQIIRDDEQEAAS